MDRIDLVEVYKELIEKDSPREINHTARRLAGERVPTETELVGAETRFNVNDLWGEDFIPDKEGMCEILQMIKNEFGTNSKARINLIQLLTFLRNTVVEYFGGTPQDLRERDDAYITSGGTLRLSDMKGKGLGACAEWATVAHNCLVVMQKAGFMKTYTSQLVSGITKGENGQGKHTFIILANNDKEKDSIIFDIAQDLYDAKKNQLVTGVFASTPEELEKFKMGGTITPENIFKKFGIPLDSRSKNVWE